MQLKRLFFVAHFKSEENKTETSKLASAKPKEAHANKNLIKLVYTQWISDSSFSHENYL